MINCTECDGSGIVETVLGDGFTSFGTCLTCQRRNMADDYPRIAEENRTLKHQNEQMKQALEWYADYDNYSTHTAHSGHDVIDDNGKRAREALKEGAI